MEGLAPDSYTLGVEEEYAIVHPDTRALKSHINTMMRMHKGKRAIGENLMFQPELHQSVVEVATPVCRDIRDARRDIRRLRRMVIERAEKTGARIVAVGTHPFSDWKDQRITRRKRYLQIVDDMQDVARGNLIFGMHVHVGVPNSDVAVEIMNEARYFLPHLLALSTSSPFWLGRESGLKSTRSGVFRRFPRTGIPSKFRSASELSNYVNILVDTGCIEDAGKIWWDIRAHHRYPTVEFRICDLTTKLEETLCLVAIIQALVFQLRELRMANLGWRDYPRALIEENKWRAMRHGIHGKLIDFGKRQEVEFKQLMEELLIFLSPALDELGCREEAEYAMTICEEGTSADRQLANYQESDGDFNYVVDRLIEETRAGVFDREEEPTVAPE
ncbi:MAG: carboxylate-amine ligase [Deltaproteobacteria bacterium]|nr:carboxylate-amine ligase [Deltaproteobacteria bacterium]